MLQKTFETSHVTICDCRLLTPGTAIHKKASNPVMDSDHHGNLDLTHASSNGYANPQGDTQHHEDKQRPQQLSEQEQPDSNDRRPHESSMQAGEAETLVGSEQAQLDPSIHVPGQLPTQDRDAMLLGDSGQQELGTSNVDTAPASGRDGSLASSPGSGHQQGVLLLLCVLSLMSRCSSCWLTSIGD